MKNMRAYVINLDAASDRWAHIDGALAKTGFGLCRVPAVDGNSIRLPDKDFSEMLYWWFHGRGTNLFEVGCYWSHIRALNTFLRTDEEYALICEDDIVLGPDLDAVVAGAMHYVRFWNILRLTGLSAPKAFKVTRLYGDYFLCVHTSRLKGSGAYLVDRKAARIYTTHLLPMRLPYDHAMDREWFFGLAAAAVTPFPISQTEKKFRSSIQQHSKSRLSSKRRWLATYPYQICNEIARWAFRYAYFGYLKLRLHS
jgi:glycosyl transferase, family 25